MWSKGAVVNANQQLWEQGDFTRIADAMREGGDALVESFGVTDGMRVLDVGCGDGTTAIPAAQRGAEVLGVDIARNLVEAGNRRARELGVDNCAFVQGDACDLEGIADDSYDLVVSIFGAMFAPRPVDVAKAFVRVARPGGRVIMGNWIPGDPTFVAQLLRVSAAYAPPPPEGFISPMRWGVPEDVVERFGAAGIPPERISCERRIFSFDFAGTPAEYLDVFRSYYGPTMNAFAGAAAAGKEDALQDELEQLFAEHDRSDDPGRTLIDAAFLQVTVRV
jgi:SAM-dependent methyltransferase